MGRIIVFANQKGGVGKTTTAVNLGAFLAEAGKKVLLVDFDPQGNLTSSLGLNTSKGSVYDCLAQGRDSREVILAAKQENLFVFPSDINLSGAAVELLKVEEGREYYLKNILETLRPRYDFIFIDCPPSLDLLTINGLCAADTVYVPLQCEYFALEGVTHLVRSVKRITQKLNPSLDIGGVIMTMYDPRTNLAKGVFQEVVHFFKDKVFRTIIPRNIPLAEAPSHGMTINQFRPTCAGAKAYANLAQEVLKRG